jgi:hypothetical protein
MFAEDVSECNDSDRSPTLICLLACKLILDVGSFSGPLAQEY